MDNNYTFKSNIFTQVGEGISKMALKLSQDQVLIRLLKDMSENPLDKNKMDFDLTERDFEKGNIRTVPNVSFEDVSQGIVCITPIWGGAGEENDSFSLVNIDCDIYFPLNKWSINNPIQRPYITMSKIYELLNKSRVTGIGTLRFSDFNLDIVSDEVSLHTMKFLVDTVG